MFQALSEWRVWYEYWIKAQEAQILTVIFQEWLIIWENIYEYNMRKAAHSVLSSLSVGWTERLA